MPIISYVNAKSVVPLALATTIGGCGTGAYVPPEALAPPTVAFSKDVATFAADVQKYQLTPYPRSVRSDLIAAVVRNTAETSGWTDATFRQGLATLNVETYLCLPRYSVERVSSRVLYVGAVASAAGSLESALGASSPQASTLLKALGTDYSISVKTLPVPTTFDDWTVGDEGKKCLNQVTQGDPYVTRSYIGKEFALAAIPAAVSLVDTVWSIAKPVVTNALNNVDIERRNAAVRDYFSNPSNVQLLEDNLAKTEVYLDREYKLSQTRASGRAATTARYLLDPSSPHWKSVQSVLGTAQCRVATAALHANKTTPAGVRCLDSAMAALAPALQSALDAADAFDTSMDLQMPDPGERLSKQINTLQSIALGNQPPADQLKALWAAMLRYSALYEAVGTADSDANKKKITDDWTDVMKPLQ